MSDRIAEAAMYAESLANHLYNEVGEWGGQATTYRCVANLMFILNNERLPGHIWSALNALAESFPPGVFPAGTAEEAVDA